MYPFIVVSGLSGYSTSLRNTPFGIKGDLSDIWYVIGGTWHLRGGTVEPEETAIARHWLYTAKNTHGTVVELFHLPSFPRL
jgi:hypothetical protein